MSGLSAYHHPGSCEECPEQDTFGLIDDESDADDSTKNNVTTPLIIQIQDEAGCQFEGTGTGEYYYQEENDDRLYGREP